MAKVTIVITDIEETKEVDFVVTSDPEFSGATGTAAQHIAAFLVEKFSEFVDDTQANYDAAKEKESEA